MDTAKQLAEGTGGRVSMRSDKQELAQVTMTVPSPPAPVARDSVVVPWGPDDPILLIDDNELFAEALALALRMEGHYVGCLEVGPTGDVLAAALRERPGIALLGLDLGPCGNAAGLIAPLTAAGIKVVVVTATTDRAEWGHCLCLGAVAVLGTSGHLVEVIDTVRRLRVGLPGMSRTDHDELLACWRAARGDSGDIRDRFARLTTRERLILAALQEGHGVHDIAIIDVVSQATVRTQVKSILAKLEVTSQLAAVALARRTGWRSHEKPLDAALAASGRRG